MAQRSRCNGTASIGIVTIPAAGFSQGTFMLPMKCTRGWAWENVWLGLCLTTYLVCLWLLALVTILHLKKVLTPTGGARVVRTVHWGLAWDSAP